METSSVIFFCCIGLCFIVLRWHFSRKVSIAQRNPSRRRTQDPHERGRLTNETEAASALTSTTSGLSVSTRETTYRRPVQQGMVEVVRALAPTLTEQQIRYDLERTGSVELTVERYFSLGDLPYPPGVSIPVREHTAPRATSNSPAKANRSLLDMFGVDVSKADTALNQSLQGMKWSDDKNERAKSLQSRREMMILKARRGMEDKLKKNASS